MITNVTWAMVVARVPHVEHSIMSMVTMVDYRISGSAWLIPVSNIGHCGFSQMQQWSPQPTHSIRLASDLRFSL